MHELQNVPAMLVFVVGYIVMMIVIGSIVFRKAVKAGKENVNEFYLSGRTLGKFIVVGTILATYTGSGTITGGPNTIAFNFGFWAGAWFVLPGVASCLVLWLLAPLIREKNYMTNAQLLEDVYGPSARVFSSIIIALAFISIVAYQYQGLGFVLNATTGISVEVATIVCMLMVIALAASGGLNTVAITDAPSAFLMTFGLLLGVPFLLNHVGGWSWVIENSAPERLGLMYGQTPTRFLGTYLPLFVLIIADQNYYQRIIAAKDLKAARFGLVGTAMGLCLIFPIVSLLSFVGSIYFGGNIMAGQSLIATATVMPLVIGGIVLASAAAFTITTGNSYLLSAASCITIDIYKNKIKSDATEKQQMNFSRLFIIIAGLGAFFILQFFPNILAIQLWAYTIYGAGITPALLAAMFWKRATKIGGISSMLVGAGITILWEMFFRWTVGLHTVLVALPAAIIVLVVVSLLTQPSEK